MFATEGCVSQGLAALCAYESQIPKVAKSKIKGLESSYGMSTPDAHDYFRVHIEADREHSRVERELLESTLNTKDSRDLTESVDAVLDSLRGLLSGVCQRDGIACRCARRFATPGYDSLGCALDVLIPSRFRQSRQVNQ